MNLYTLCTPSHEILKNDWFLPTVKDNYTLCIKNIKQAGGIKNSIFGVKEFHQTVIKKVEYIIKAIHDNWGKAFVYSDIDVQFFRKTEDLLTHALQGKDIVFQRDAPFGMPASSSLFKMKPTACTGFFICFANQRVLNLWNRSLDMMNRRLEVFDQDAVNLIIQNDNKLKLNWEHLPIQFFGGGTLTGLLWSPGDVLQIPENIAIHHANYTKGIKNKIAQLKYVKNIVKKRI